MVRNPYAVCEGIFRQYGFLSHKFEALAEFMGTGRSLPEAAATHAVNCLARQRRNLERRLRPEAGEARRGAPIVRPGRGVFFSYETMCARPQRTARAIEAAAPALNDLELRLRLPVKGRYREMLTDMNARQIERLDERGRRDAQPGVRGASGDPRLLRLRPAADRPAAKRVAASPGRPACCLTVGMAATHLPETIDSYPHRLNAGGCRRDTVLSGGRGAVAGARQAPRSSRGGAPANARPGPGAMPGRCCG